jgi:DNA polymerase III delta subunit
MTDELAAGRPADALRRWRQLVQMDASSEFRAVTWLGMWLEKVRKGLGLRKKGLPPFAIAKELRIWPANNIDPFFKTAEALGSTGAARAIDLLVDIDRQSKSGVGDAAANVERFILTVSGMISGSGTGDSPVSSQRHGRVAHAT